MWRNSRAKNPIESTVFVPSSVVWRPDFQARRPQNRPPWQTPPSIERAGARQNNSQSGTLESQIFVVCEELFTPQGVTRIREELDRLPPFAAELSSGPRDDYRRVTAREFGRGHEWILQPILDIVSQANDEQFGFEIDGIDIKDP